MKGIKSILAIGASLFFLTASGCMNTAENTSKKAKPSEYLSIPEGIDYKSQVTVGDNYVEIKQPIHKLSGKRERVIGYKDYNEDGNVDVYDVSDMKEEGKGLSSGKIVVHICSEQVWYQNYRPVAQHVIVKYADKELQDIINKDYELLRQKGTRVHGGISSSIKVE